MSIAAARTYLVQSIPLDTASAGTVINYQVGYIHVARFQTADGLENLSGLIEVALAFGVEDWLPLGPNAEVMMIPARDQVRVRWAAQAGITCTLVLAQDPKQFQMANPPGRTLVSTAAGTTIAVGTATIGTSAGLIRAANSARQSLIIQNDGAADIYVGPAAVAVADGLRVPVGATLTLDKTTAALYGISGAAGNVVRWLEEA